MEFFPITFKLGSIQHAKGFVVNKLFEQKRFGGKHLAAEDLPTGYPRRWRGLLPAAIEALKTEGIIRLQHKRTRRGYGEHLTLVWEKLSKARGLLNGYRASVDLPRLGKDLKTFLPVEAKRL